MKKQHSKLSAALNITLLPMLVLAVDQLIPGDPGFISLYAIPFLILPVLTAALSGLTAGYLSFVTTFFLILISLFINRIAIDSPVRIMEILREYGRHTIVTTLFSILFIYIFGKIQAIQKERYKKIKERLRTVVHQNQSLNRQNVNISAVTKELEERISRQEKSLTNLYIQIQKLNTLEVRNALSALLETVQIFSESTRASVWKHDSESRQLKLVSSLGDDNSRSASTQKSLDDTIEGWVFRNNTLFSIRMIMYSESLANLSREDTIYCLPLVVNSKVWGVLCIEDLPFVKYNRHTEHILQIILHLAEQPLTRAIEYEEMTSSGETDEQTGLPLFTQFYRDLEKSIDQGIQGGGKFSLLILDIANYSKLIDIFREEEVRNQFNYFIRDLRTISQLKGSFYHYKQKNQLALLLPDLDFDGVSYLCLEILSHTNQMQLAIKEVPLPLEVIIGFASYTHGKTPKDLLQQAEHLLEMQQL